MTKTIAISKKNTHELEEQINYYLERGIKVKDIKLSESMTTLNGEVIWSISALIIYET